MRVPSVFENRVYEITKRIPPGKISTYGEIARALGNKNLARAVGNALHKNPHPFSLYGKNENAIPCHRVVSVHGFLAKHFSLGETTQQKLLLREGVSVSQNRVSLAKYFFSLA